ncbi:MAG TPA: hypothetical protein VN381_04055 [Anaerovoracaceae bacterium]|nr:hypothetical protein [Anaerovoracaceae bacterium]
MQHENNMARLEKWILENEKDWYTICGMGEKPISEKEFRRLWEILKENGFYDVTLVLLTCHYYAVQDCVAQNIKIIKKALDDELKRREIDPNTLS